MVEIIPCKAREDIQAIGWELTTRTKEGGLVLPKDFSIRRMDGLSMLALLRNSIAVLNGASNPCS